MKPKQIQVHYVDTKGRRGVMNKLASENADLLNTTGKDYANKRQKVLDHAHKIAGQWAEVFPDDRFTVVEL